MTDDMPDEDLAIGRGLALQGADDKDIASFAVAAHQGQLAVVQCLEQQG